MGSNVSKRDAWANGRWDDDKSRKMTHFSWCYIYVRPEWNIASQTDPKLTVILNDWGHFIDLSSGYHVDIYLMQK